MSCHPSCRLTLARIDLKLLCALTTAEVARAFLAPESRSRNASCGPSAPGAANIRFELPGPTERPARLDAVRE